MGDRAMSEFLREIMLLEEKYGPAMNQEEFICVYEQRKATMEDEIKEQEEN